MDYAERERLLLAPYAMHAAESAGRVHAEPTHAYRSPYQRDRDRVVHSAAYRRLAYKTQVFTGPLLSRRGGDYHRTRLTHTQEVASIARTLARALRLNEDLVEALALVHDIGHPPFGHAGEDLLNERLAGQGGFNHNRQALRIVERIERRYPEFPGLNLTREVLEGQGRRGRKGAVAGDHETASPLLEVQVVDAADSIAYDAHDADDALELGVLELGELREVDLWREATAAVERRFTCLDDGQLRRAVIHQLLDRQVGDLLGCTRRRIAERRPASPDEARRSPPLVAGTPELAEQKRLLERFLFDRVYRHPLVLAHRLEATAALGELFDRAVADAAANADAGGLPAPFGQIAAEEGPRRAAADYVSSVTDRFALDSQQTLAGG
ncbi:MAG: dGTP triphosphohydrolase [Planctomycetota bacterium]